MSCHDFSVIVTDASCLIAFLQEVPQAVESRSELIDFMDELMSLLTGLIGPERSRSARTTARPPPSERKADVYPRLTS